MPARFPSGASARTSVRTSVAPVIGLLLLLACSKSDDQANQRPVPPLMTGWGNASVLGGGGVLTYDLTVEPADLDRLPGTATALKEEFVPADLTVSGRSVGSVGLRFTGVDGAQHVCFENGVANCPKASLKIKADFVDPSKNFESLKRLNFHSLLGDPSQLRERLAVEIFRRMGIAAPRVAHAFITINGQAKGLFATAEEPDELFAQSHWPETPVGNLYKEAWPIEIDPDHYTAHLLTNLAAPDNAQMAMFANALFAATPATLAGALDRFAPVDQLLAYLAVDRTINNFDGVTSFYCDMLGKDCTNRNFFWYQRRSDNRFVLVPSELGDTLFVTTSFDQVPPWDQIPADCGRRNLVEGTAIAPPGCDLIFQALAGAGRPAYDKALDKLRGVWNVAALQGLLDQWASEIEPAVALDPFGPGRIAWRAAVTHLKSVVAALGERLEATRAAVLVPPFGLTAPGTTGFEEASRLGFHLGATSQISGHSGGVFDLSEQGALTGGRDALLSFELINDSEAGRPISGPYINARLPLAAGPVALPGLRRIHFRMAADSIRNVRLEIDSPAYGPGDDDKVRYGHEFIVSKQNAEVSISVNQLARAEAMGSGPTLSDVLGAVSGLLIVPAPRGRDEDGLLPQGKSDLGFIRIDDITIEAD